MELSDSKIKKFLIFPEMGHCNFQPKLEKIHPEKISCASGNRKPPKKFYIFSKKSFFYISENGNAEKVFYISGNGTFLYFRKP